MTKKAFYRTATPSELERMVPLYRLWYEGGQVPIFLVKDGRIIAQSLDGAMGGLSFNPSNPTHPVARLVSERWLESHKEWLIKHQSETEQPE